MNDNSIKMMSMIIKSLLDTIPEVKEEDVEKFVSTPFLDSNEEFWQGYQPKPNMKAAQRRFVERNLCEKRVKSLKAKGYEIPDAKDADREGLILRKKIMNGLSEYGREEHASRICYHNPKGVRLASKQQRAANKISVREANQLVEDFHQEEFDIYVENGYKISEIPEYNLQFLKEEAEAEYGFLIVKKVDLKQNLKSLMHEANNIASQIALYEKAIDATDDKLNRLEKLIDSINSIK